MPPTLPEPDQPVLIAEGITKVFGITRALDCVSVSFRPGEVHALMGENGAGKSTLGKVIAGLHRQDAGRVVMDGRELRPGALDDAYDAGIRIVHQELAQCPNLSVAENLCLHDIPRSRGGLVDFSVMERRARRLLARLEPAIDVRAPLGDLSPGHRQIVQIASSLDDREDASTEARGAGVAGRGGRARVIVLDEPTSSLSIAEVDRLLAIVRMLRDPPHTLTLIYVSHRMSEIFAVCDRVTVLRDGRFVATSNVREIDESTLVEQMIGRKVEATARRAAPRPPEPFTPDDPLGAAETAALRIRNLSSPETLDDISLAVAPGEILGVGGLVGAGRSELLDAVFGLDTAVIGHIHLGRAVLCSPGRGHAGVRAAIAAGVGYVPEDRKQQGLFFQLGVGENIVVPVMQRIARAIGLRDFAAERAHIDERLRSFQVKTAGVAALPGSLSGGNQQKLLIARWMGRSTSVLLLDEPTRGIDVGTKAEIYGLIRRAAEQGLAVLLVSSDMPELLALSDRIVVLSDGRLTGELRGEEMTQSNILRLATIEAARPAGSGR